MGKRTTKRAKTAQPKAPPPYEFDARVEEVHDALRVADGSPVAVVTLVVDRETARRFGQRVGGTFYLSIVATKLEPGDISDSTSVQVSP